MAYTTLADVKEYLSIKTSTADDDLLTDLISAAQAAIDAYCGYTFEAASDTYHYFDAVRDVDGATLHFDTMCASITEIAIRDDTTISEDNYIALPPNGPPYYGVRLISTTTQSWSYVDYPENALIVSGKWAYSESADADIAHACKRLVAWMYRQKDTSADVDRPLLTGDGNVIMPSAIPNDVKALLQPYRRLV